MTRRALAALAAGLAAFGFLPGDGPSPLVHEQETRFGALRQLTFGGENAEAYFSFDETRLIFQSTRDGRGCDQEYVLDVATGAVRMVSTGKGRTTCGYFFPGDSTILFASTHHLRADCPPVPDFSQGYTWAVYPEYDIFTTRADGGTLRQLTSTPGYDAEATVSPRGDRIVFTSLRNGDLDLYVPIADVEALYAAAGEPKQLWRVPEAGHREIDKRHPAEYRERVVGFFERCL